MGKRVTVEFLFKGIINTDENEIGVLFDNGQVIVVDAIGGVSIHNAHPSPNADSVVVKLEEDGNDYLIDNPELIVNLILNR
jgi:hypothetical protein